MSDCQLLCNAYCDSDEYASSASCYNGACWNAVCSPLTTTTTTSSCQDVCSAYCATGEYASSASCYNGACTDYVCSPLSSGTQSSRGICFGGARCNCVIGHVGNPEGLCILTVTGIVVGALLALSVVGCILRGGFKKKGSQESDALATAQIEEGTVVAADDEAVTNKFVPQPDIRGFTRGLLSVILLAIVLSGAVDMTVLEVEYYSGATFTTTFTADLTNLAIGFSASTPVDVKDFQFAEAGVSWDKYCSVVSTVSVSAAVESLRNIGVDIPGKDQCALVEPTRKVLTAAIAFFAAAAVLSLYAEAAGGKPFLCTFVGWTLVVTAIGLWATVFGTLAGTQAGVGILLSIACFGVVLVTHWLPTDPKYLSSRWQAFREK